MPTPTNEETPVAVMHPDWCDATACTATPAVAKGESHRGSPTTVSVWSLFGTLEITACLSQAHCRWSTDVYVDLDVRGLYDNYQATGGRAAFPVENLAKLVGVLADLAATGKAWRDREVAEELAAIGLRAPTTAGIGHVDAGRCEHRWGGGTVKGSMLVTRTSAALVALVAGYVSYLHIVDVAMVVGERREVAFALPVTIDALMVMSTLAMLAARRSGRKPSPWAYGGFLFGVAVSVTCNVASAAPTWPARGVAAIPAVSLLLAVEVLIRATTYQAARESTQPADERPAPPPAPPRPAAPRPATNGSDGHGRKGGRKRRGEAATAAASALAAHPDAPVAELARLAGVSRATVRRARTNGTDSHAGGVHPDSSQADRHAVASSNHR